MISRYALYDIAGLSKRFAITAGLPKGVKPHYNISPTLNAHVIVSENGAPAIKRMQWGLMASGAKDTNSVFRYKSFVVSSENVFNKHSWEIATRERRCIVPANGFYELNEGSKEKRAFYGELKDKSLVGFAGIYNMWQDADGVEHNSFAILTAEPNRDMPDRRMRMPVILAPHEEAMWLDPAVTDTGSIYTMLRPYPSDTLNVYEVSPKVHLPKSNHVSLLKRI